MAATESAAPEKGSGAAAGTGGGALRVHLALFVVQAAFSGFHVVGKVVLESLDPLALAGLRILGATPILLLAAWHHDRRLPTRRELPWLVLLGLLGVFANQVLFIVGLSFTTAINAAILMPSIPVFAVGIGALLGIERATWKRVAGVVAAAAGALVLLDPTSFSLADGTVRGNLLILTNCLSYATFLVLQRRVVERLPWRTLIAWAFLFGGLGVVAVAAPELAALDPGEVPAEAWWGVAYIIAAPTLVAYALNTWAVRRSSPALVAAYVTLQPLLSTLLAAVVLGEAAGWREAAGFLLIVAGLWGVSVRAATGAAPRGAGEASSPGVERERA